MTRKNSQTPKGCPKCGKMSGDDWSQCEGDCPIPMSPHFKSLDKSMPVNDSSKNTKAE